LEKGNLLGVVGGGEKIESDGKKKLLQGERREYAEFVLLNKGIS